ncbi:MAG: MATE family efflux transporter [Acidimicrobiia bacterium]
MSAPTPPDRRRYRLTSPYDREIVRLAVPALGALVAEPLYVLADTAIVGHLGTRPLAGLAVAGIVLTAAFAVFNFLAYSTTGAVARRLGAGRRREATTIGVDACWLAVGLGVGLAVVGVVAAGWLVDVMGASDGARDHAITYLRISALGAPAYLVALAGAGFLRGMQDTRTTLVIALGANVANLALELLLVYGFDAGIAGSAWGTVTAQVGAAAAYVLIVRRSAVATGARVTPDREGVKTVAVIGGPLVVRTASLLAVSITVTALAARIGDTQVAAHQIAFQVNLLLALALDAIAIAAQAMVGRYLGAGHPHDARAASTRMIVLGIAAGALIALVVGGAAAWFVPLFTEDRAVVDLTVQVLVIVAVLQPLAAVVFVLDGVLIGAGDQRFLAVAMVVASFGVFAPLAATISVVGGGLLALWGAIAAWLVARAVGMVGRFAGTRWQRTGAAVA